MIRFIKNNKFYLLGFFILFLVVLANIFPKGYVFGGGDTAQLIDAKNSFGKLFFNWSGSTSIFYFIFYCLDSIGISDTAQLSWCLGLFIFGAYISFNVFSKLFFRKIGAFYRMIFSLFYALNVYTLYIFSSNWGFSHFQWLYVFIPMLFGFYLKFLITGKKIFGAWFLFILLLASPGFGNQAFALSLAIIMLIFTAFLIIFKVIRLDKTSILNLSGLFILACLISSFWILPSIPKMKTAINETFYSSVLNLNSWISSTSNPIINTLRLIHYSNDYYPNNFPYKSIYFLKGFFTFLTFMPIFLILSGWFNIRKIEREKQKYFLVFFFLLIVLIILVARVREPFEIINYYFYNLWGINILRGYEKTAIFTPFVLAVLLIITFQGIAKDKGKKLFIFIMIAILLTPLPFYFGKIQQNMSYRFSHAKPGNKDFSKSDISFLVKIPSEYYQIRDKINGDKEKFFLAALPYTRNDGTNIVDYVEWKFYGIDITENLYNKNFIEANAYYFPGWNFAESFNDDYDGRYDWIIKLLGMMDAKYIIYHKDATKNSVKQSEFKMEILEKENLIKKIEENKYFVLYEINRDYFISYITFQKGEVFVEPNPDSISRNFDKVKKSALLADFQEVNPKKYLVNFDGNYYNESLILSEPFSNLWKAYYLTEEGKEIEIKDHFLARGYANGWKTKPQPNSRQILIEYYPNRLSKYGIMISLVTALFLIGYLLRCAYVREKSQKSFY